MVSYLMHFWNHQVGHTVTDGVTNFSILEIDKDYPNQVLTESGWRFIQDLEWNPSVQEACQHCLPNIGLNINKNDVSKGTFIKPLPNTLEELSDIISDFRAFSLNN